VKLVTELLQVAQYIEDTPYRSTNHMANNREKESIITNVDTRARREWIASALESVRRHMDAATFVPSTVESLGHEAAPMQSLGDSQAPTRPRLYLAWSQGRRRSGT